MQERITENIKAVLFDHDDTLVATIGSKWAEHKHVARTYYGKELTDDEIKVHWGKPLPELVCALYGTTNVEEALANNYDCHEAFPKLLFEWSIPTLQRLHNAGKLTGIITATSRFSFEYDLTDLAFPRNCIDYTQTADDTDYHKPDPRVFEPAVVWLQQRNINPSQVVYVADALHDMIAAKGAGFQFIGVHTGLVTGEEFSSHGVPNIPTLGDIMPFIS